MITVYVAGPYSKPCPVRNTHRALRVADKLWEHGFAPFVPHLSLFWDVVSPAPYEHWLEYDLEWLARCDALVRMPGASPGADREVAHAEALGIPVYYGLNELLHAMTVDADDDDDAGDDAPDPEPEDDDGPQLPQARPAGGVGGPGEA